MLAEVALLVSVFVVAACGLVDELAAGTLASYRRAEAALAVSIAFPPLLVPQLGLIRTGAFFGLLNAAVAVWALWLFRAELRRVAAHAFACAATIAALLAAFASADRVTTWAEDRFYADTVCSVNRRLISASSSPPAGRVCGCS